MAIIKKSTIKKTVSVKNNRPSEAKSETRGNITRSFNSLNSSPGVRQVDTVYTEGRGSGSMTTSSSRGPRYQYDRMQKTFNSASKKKK